MQTSPKGPRQAGEAWGGCGVGFLLDGCFRVRRDDAKRVLSLVTLLPARPAPLPAAATAAPTRREGTVAPFVPSSGTVLPGWKGPLARWCDASKQRYRNKGVGGRHVASPPALQTRVRLGPAWPVRRGAPRDRPSSTCADVHKLLCSVTSRHRFFLKKQHLSSCSES